MQPPIYGAKPILRPDLMAAMLAKYSIKPNQQISVLPFAGAIGKEIRHLYFEQALDKEKGQFRQAPELTKYPKGEKILQHLQVTRLFSFGECNAFCPYCKRDMQFIDEQGNVIAATTTAIENLFEMAEGAMMRGEVIRFSGGDPVLFPKVCMAISEYVYLSGGTVSIAHNGSGPGFVEKLLPFMSSAAIDIKAPLRYMGAVLGLSQKQGEIHFENSFKTQRLFHGIKNPNGAILDVRTPVFGAHENPLVPQTSLSDMMELGYYITQNNDPKRTFWTWRMYKPVHGCDWNAPILEDVISMMETVSKAYPFQWMGIRAKWHGGGMLYFYGGECVNPQKISDAEKAGSGNTGELL